MGKVVIDCKLKECLAVARQKTGFKYITALERPY